MQRLAIISLLLAACGTSDDQRPHNLDYITTAILVPSCGAAVCHSSFRQQSGFLFDTVDGARATFQLDAKLIEPTGDDPNAPPGLILNLTREQPGAPRMPYDAPLPDVDIALIDDWLRAGAPGVCNGLSACLGTKVVPCHDAEINVKPSGVETEKGAYDLSKLRTARDCASESMVCRNGACE